MPFTDPMALGLNCAITPYTVSLPAPSRLTPDPGHCTLLTWERRTMTNSGGRGFSSIEMTLVNGIDRS